MSNGDDKKSSISFDIVSYWLQGRIGDDWQNLESQERAKDANARFKALRDGGQYDELRLIEATLSAFTKETYYRTVAHYISEESVRAGYEPVSDVDQYTGAEDNDEIGEEAAVQPRQETPPPHQEEAAKPTPDTGQAETAGAMEKPWPAGESIDHPIDQPESQQQEAVFGDGTDEEDDKETSGQSAQPADESLLELPEFLDRPHADQHAEAPRRKGYIFPVLLILLAGGLAAVWLQLPQADRSEILQRLQQEMDILLEQTQDVLSEGETDDITSSGGPSTDTVATAPAGHASNGAPRVDFVPPIEHTEQPEPPNRKPRVFVLERPATTSITNEEENTATVALASRDTESPTESSQSGDLSDDVPPTRPAARIRYYSRHLALAMDGTGKVTLSDALADWPDDLPLQRARFQIIDEWGAGDRSVMDHALLNGYWDAAKKLAQRDLKPSPYVIHQAFGASPSTRHEEIRDFLLSQGIGLNSEWQGKTPLLAALDRDDTVLAHKLLDHGASPIWTTSSGRSPLKELRRSGDKALLAHAVAAQYGDSYRELLMGFNWRTKLDQVRETLGPCRAFGGDLTACQLPSTAPYPSADIAIAQFEDAAGGALVAIQIDSTRFSSADDAREAFNEVVKTLETIIPQDHIGFSTTTPDDKPDLFASLGADGRTSPYFAYWSDQGRRRPVFVHASLNRLDSDSGYYRVLIGNPFHQ